MAIGLGRHGRNILVQMVFIAATSVSDIVDEFRDFSLGDREDRQMLVKTLRSTISRGGTPNEHRSH